MKLLLNSCSDIHGLMDTTIPYNPEGPDNLGAGPDGTVIASDGWYYHIKMIYLMEVLEHMNCNMTSQHYPTHMDGSGNGWTCSQWTGCDQGKEVVHCNGNWGHDYPFNQRYIEGIIVLWDFMKTHRKQ